MCKLPTDQRKVLIAGLIMAEHLNLLAARIDYRANKSAHWERFHKSALASRALRETLALPTHGYNPKCCAPDETDPQGAVAAYAVITYGINPTVVDEEVERRIATKPPKKAKNEAEVIERTAESTRRRNQMLLNIYEEAPG